MSRGPEGLWAPSKEEQKKKEQNKRRKREIMKKTH